MIQDIAPDTFDPTYRPSAQPQPQDRVFAVLGGKLLVDVGQGGESAQVDVPRVGELDFGMVSRLTYAFSLNGASCWGYAGDEDELASFPHASALFTLQELRGGRRCAPALTLALHTAYHLGTWHQNNRFCGRCAAPMRHDAHERALRCTRCNNLVFPRINPAVIVGVLDPASNRIVITRYARSRGVTYDALVAGFVEIGETLEQCVAREVYEEVGLRVKNIRYAGSQPWGTASDVLSGFWCDVDGDSTLRLDTQELARARWARPEEVVGQPDDLSLTNHMMCTFRDGGSIPA